MAAMNIMTKFSLWTSEANLQFDNEVAVHSSLAIKDAVTSTQKLMNT